MASAIASGETLDEKCKYIDAQVRAIWWALVHDYAIGYINPPPSFVENEQRLRTPSEVVQGKRGTCIDLALLLAACLEYIEIYPVIFLLRDHAFPGYWRSEPGYQRLTLCRLAFSWRATEPCVSPLANKRAACLRLFARPAKSRSCFLCATMPQHDTVLLQCHCIMRDSIAA